LKKEIEELREEKTTSPATEELEAERDEAIRDKNSLEQDLIATNNQLKSKGRELDNREKELERIKKEFSEKDKALNASISEWRKKYNDKVKQLDAESSEYNKLEEENEKLQTKITELEKERTELLKMPGEFPSEDEGDEKKKKNSRPASHIQSQTQRQEVNLVDFIN
jgi:uncharacterized protein YdcH (DUF465 family)